MLIFLPILTLFLTSLVLVILYLIQPKFRYPWFLAAIGSLLAFAFVFLWQIHFPQNISLTSWNIVPTSQYSLTWLADGISWPYAVALAALCLAVIWTSVVRSENELISWVGTLTLSALGILAVASANPLTLLLAWSAIDIFELVTMLRSTDGENLTEGVIIAFTVRLVGIGLVLWSDFIGSASGTPLDFRSTPNSVGIYLLLAVGLRLGVLPLHLPYRKENVFRRGFGTTLRLVSAASSLALLARIPATVLNSAWTPFLIILTAFTSLYAGWMWLRSSDETLGRPFWVLGIASLAIEEILRGNPTGSTAWGIVLILCGGVIFLFSSRSRTIIWLPLIGLWGLSTLPFSVTASAWQAEKSSSWFFVIPFVLSQALFMAGFLRLALHPGEKSLESEGKWSKIIYPTALFFLFATNILLGLWGWPGQQTIGTWWLALLIIPLTAGFYFLSQKILMRVPPSIVYGQWTTIFRIEWLYRLVAILFTMLRRIVDTINGFLEGEGGLLWSYLLLVLILSIMITQGR